MSANVVSLPTAQEILRGKNGWEVAAGQDVQVKRKTTRYILAINKSPSPTIADRAAILATKNTRTDWYVAHLGKPVTLSKMFEKLDAENELR